jgi:tRNA (guanine-N7-)-methyltransferase
VQSSERLAPRGQRHSRQKALSPSGLRQLIGVSQQPAKVTPLEEHIARIGNRRDRLRAVLAEVVPAQTPFVWEIGCGHGHFLTAYAETHPERLCLGIDVLAERIERANRKKGRAGLANLRFIRAEARDFLAALPAAARIAAIYMLFPDPWPKRRHHKNRLLDADFLRQIASWAEKGAHLYFRTDHEAYFKETEKVLGGHSDWMIRPSDPWPFQIETIFQQKAARYLSLAAERI